MNRSQERAAFRVREARMKYDADPTPTRAGRIGIEVQNLIRELGGVLVRRGGLTRWQAPQDGGHDGRTILE